MLENSKVPINSSNRHAFILPNPGNCNLTKERNARGNLLQLKDILQQAEFLLEGQYESQPYSHYTEFYRYHLVENRFASINGQVKQNELLEAFCGFYSEGLLKSLHIDVGKLDLWIANISRKHRKSFHPYFHILMLKFLQLDVGNVFQTTSFVNAPFGHPNWPCLNFVCPDYKRNIIEEVTVRSCEKTKESIGRFTCPKCGFSYTRKGRDQVQEDRYRYNRIMDFGVTWKKDLHLLLEKELSYRQIARMLGVDTNTVIKYKQIIIPKGTQMNQSHGENGVVKSRRREWVQLQKDFPDISKTELRKKSPAVYTFLYRHDKDWLNANSPEHQKKKTLNNRIDWIERDEEIFKKVQKIANDMKNNPDKPIRITLRALGDGIGERSLLEKHLDKMEKTKAYIEQICESEQEFRFRRIRHVIHKMKEEGESIKAWKVIKRAAIKKKFYHEVQELLLRYIE
nr:TnsD family Tn7-like transposition protein [Bacillus sp. FJAT-49711]